MTAHSRSNKSPPMVRNPAHGHSHTEYPNTFLWLVPEATGATERTGAGHKISGVLRELTSLPEEKWPSESDLEYAAIHLLRKLELLRPSEQKPNTNEFSMRRADSLGHTGHFKGTIILSTFSRTELLNVNTFQTGLQATHRRVLYPKAGKSRQEAGFQCP